MAADNHSQHNNSQIETSSVGQRLEPASTTEHVADVPPLELVPSEGGSHFSQALHDLDTSASHGSKYLHADDRDDNKDIGSSNLVSPKSQTSGQLKIPTKQNSPRVDADVMEGQGSHRGSGHRLSNIDMSAQG